MLIRKGVTLLEDTPGPGDLVQRQREYILSIRFTLNQGDILPAPPLSYRPDISQEQHENGFFDHRTYINRDCLIPGLFYAVQGMRIGGYRKVSISPHLAYGETGIPDKIPPNAKLIAEIEVLRRVVARRSKRPDPGAMEGTMLSQEDLCRRYHIARLTLWQWRKTGHVPAPVVIGRTVRWRQSTLEQWEADDRPRVRPFLDEAHEQRLQALKHLSQLRRGSSDGNDGGLAELAPAQREELVRLAQDIDQRGNQILDMMMELALLIDEAGQWHGPPLDKLLEDDEAALRQWPNLVGVLKKALTQ